MSAKNGLFDSDDEDDIQYNPDEGEDETENLEKPAEPAPVPKAVPLPPVTKPKEAEADEEEEEKIQTIPVKPPTSVPTPSPVPAKPSSSAKYEEESEFTVSDPVNTGHVTYTVKGRDEDGDFEGSRRYNDFFHLRHALINRWPGTFVPPIPAKKAVGNKDDKYIEHRRHFLQRFLRKLGKLPHLLNSDEFKLFARPSGEIEKMLAMMPKMTPQALVERYKANLHIDEYPDEFLVKQCREVINEFNAFCKKVLPTLKVVREQTGKMVPIRTQQNENYKSLIECMAKFEEEALSQYSDSNYNKFIVGDPSSPELKNQCEEMSKELSNPFQDFHNWILGEIADIEALQEAIHCRDKTIAHKGKLETKKKTDVEELNKLNAGKKTLKTIFKSSSGKQTKITTLSSSISQVEKDIEDVEKLIKMIEVHLGETVIPSFKDVQMKDYYKICFNTASMEIDDSNRTAKFWAAFLENRNIKSS